MTYLRSEHYEIKYAQCQMFYAVIGSHNSNMFATANLAIEYAEKYILNKD